MDEIQEKINDLENNLVNQGINANPQLMKLFDTKNENHSEIAQQLLKNILKYEMEIERLRTNRRKMIKEHLNKEALNLEYLENIYSVVGFYAKN